MSEESDKVSLREHLQEQIRSVDRYFTVQLAMSREAIQKAEEQLNKRLEGMNEFRDTLKDQASKFATQDQLQSIEKRLQAIERNLSSGEGRTSIVTVLWAIGASLAVALIARYVFK
jgi:septation ring formation regulator EzrA